MLGAPQNSQNEPQNLTTSPSGGPSPVLMAPPPVPGTHWHPIHIMYSAPPPPPSSSASTTPPSSEAHRLGTPLWGQEGGTTPGHGRPADVDPSYNINTMSGHNSEERPTTPLQALEVEEEELESKPKIKKEIKKKRKVADLLAEGIDPTKLEENSSQVKDRFDKGCDCDADNCFKTMNSEFVFRHRLNVAELTKNEHDMYLMGVTMACLANPEETSRHKERKRLRASYVFQGKKVCLDAFLYLENCTHYQLKAIRKHVMVNGVTPRVHGNHGKKPPNTFPLDTYRHAAAFLQNYVDRYSPNVTSKKGSKAKSPPVYLPADITRKKIHNAYKEFCEHFEPDVKVMGYSSFRHFMKEQFPNVKFFRIDKKNERGGGNSDDDDDNTAPSESNVNVHTGGASGSSTPAINSVPNNATSSAHAGPQPNPPDHLHPPHSNTDNSNKEQQPPTPPQCTQLPIDPHHILPHSTPVSVSHLHAPITSNYQYTPVQLPLNLQTQQPLYSGCMQGGVFMSGAQPNGSPHPGQPRPPTSFPYTNL